MPPSLGQWPSGASPGAPRGRGDGARTGKVPYRWAALSTSSPPQTLYIYRFWAMRGTKPYTFIRFGDIHGTKPNVIIGFGGGCPSSVLPIDRRDRAPTSAPQRHATRARTLTSLDHATKTNGISTKETKLSIFPLADFGSFFGSSLARDRYQRLRLKHDA